MHRTNPNITPLDTTLVEQLMSPDAYDHSVTSVECMETHISWVVLTDEYAYKIKKPVVLDFLDFGDLEKRHFYCNEELRLNRQWASEIYLDVVAITEDDGQAKLGGEGPVVEYAVKMLRFDQAMRLDCQLTRDELSASDMRDLGCEIATRHMQAPVAKSEFRQRVLRTTVSQMHDNFAALDGRVNADDLAPLREWTERQLEHLTGMISERFDNGFNRICHGDLHLANLVRLEDGIRAFDCIEFNEDLRHMDVVCDYAFLVMDLAARDRADLAAHFINRYLVQSGDYAGVVLLDLYFVYRCLVRAKVATIAAQERDSAAAAKANIAEAERYCRIALRQIGKPAPMLIIMFGLSGSGKSWVSERLMATLPAIRLRSDVERKRMHGLAEHSRSDSDIGGGIYAESSKQAVYAHLLEKSGDILDARHNVILDATYLKAENRAAALSLAEERGYAAVIVDVQAPDQIAQQRLQRREQSSATVSEAGTDILDYQRSVMESLSTTEQQQTIAFNNDGQNDVNELRDAIRRFGEDYCRPGTTPHSAKSTRHR